ncbi:hypothetical protein EDC56_1744 [Sinobacterium caligoides]|uniref:Chromosome partitioning protein ParA n=1 Tax=Sinobacterium caligoides TaxID=933926 RepID=A0A3N2DPS1_9GAMM|nr:hypothetical protein [Sinobacterium caligoides]ROS01315.1 hypothetical protein EDC56_1744 [Sinobacterium caligoides]
MYHQAATGSTEAVLFVQNNRVVKEMFYPEFEAVLDHVVGLSDYAGQQQQAVFVRIDADLHVVAALFFQIHFDATGQADQQWNIPLQHLLESASEGPDMGAGPIRLVCRSQCPVSWMSAQLWDPVLSSQDNSFAVIRAAVRANKLGISSRRANTFAPMLGMANVVSSGQESHRVEPPLLAVESRVESLTDSASRVSMPEHEQISTLLKAQQLHLSTLKAEHNQQLVDVHKHYNDKSEAQSVELEALAQRLQAAERRAEQAEQLQAQQLAEFSAAREQVQERFQRARVTDHQRFDELKKQYEVESRARLSVALAESSEQLDLRQLEVTYRDNKITHLQQQVAQLEADKRRLFIEGGDQLLEQMVQSGIRFVAFQPGAGEMNIDIEDLSEYLEAPDRHAAAHCECDVTRYRAWLNHFQAPICRESHDGAVCGRTVARVDMPSYFIEGESDRCSSHTLSAKTVGRIIGRQY